MIRLYQVINVWSHCDPLTQQLMPQDDKQNPTLEAVLCFDNHCPIRSVAFKLGQVCARRVFTLGCDGSCVLGRVAQT